MIPAVGKSGAGHDVDQLVDRHLGIRQQREAGVRDLRQIVRRDVGRHAHGNARRAVDEQVRQPCGQHRRLHLLAVVVRHEIDRLPVDVGQHLAGDLLQPALRVAVGSRAVAVDRAEIPLAVDQRVAEREFLHHPDQRLVGRRIPVRVVLAEHVADHARALHVRSVPYGVGLVHREQHPPVHRLQPVADVRQRPAHDYAHRIIEVGMAHFGLEAYGKGFFGKLLHEGGILPDWVLSRVRRTFRASPGMRARPLRKATRASPPDRGGTPGQP